jgi:hypothetical protein
MAMKTDTGSLTQSEPITSCSVPYRFTLWPTGLHPWTEFTITPKSDLLVFVHMMIEAIGDGKTMAIHRMHTNGNFKRLIASGSLLAQKENQAGTPTSLTISATYLVKAQEGAELLRMGYPSLPKSGTCFVSLIGTGEVGLSPQKI